MDAWHVHEVTTDAGQPLAIITPAQAVERMSS